MGAARPLHRSSRQGRHPLEELHRRVRQLRDRAVAARCAARAIVAAIAIAIAIAIGALLAPGPSLAQEGGAGVSVADPAGADRAPVDLAPVDLAASAGRLGSDDATERAAAYRALGALPASALPAIRDRLAHLRRARPTPEDAQQILHEIRRATGSRRADDLVDVAEGIPTFLSERRDRDALRIAEPLLLLRSLERIGTTESLSLIPEVLRLDRDAWTMDGRRSTLRLGDRAAAAIIRARGHDDVAGREWARWSSRELSLDDPGRLVQRLTPVDLADVLRAWGATRTMDAMPVVASFVDDHRRFVREAAREALEAYGQNAIWQAREQMRLRVGDEADAAWGWERTMRELFRRLDERRLERVRDLEVAAREALERGDAEGASGALDALLARAPDAASPEIAALFARTGDAWLDADRRERAQIAYERAARLATGGERSAYEARLTFVEAEEALARGVLDLDAYRRAAAGDPSCARCAEVRSDLEAQAAPAVARGASDGRVPALAAAAALLGLLGAALLVRAPRPAAIEPGGEPEPEAGIGDAADTADATLPG